MTVAVNKKSGDAADWVNRIELRLMLYTPHDDADCAGFRNRPRPED
jgi:hypothetical protein